MHIVQILEEPLLLSETINRSIRMQGELLDENRNGRATVSGTVRLCG